MFASAAAFFLLCINPLPSACYFLLSLHGVICQFHFIYFYSFYLLLSEKMFFFFSRFSYSPMPSALTERWEKRTRSFLMMMTLLSSFLLNKRQSAISWNGTQNFNKYFFHFVYSKLKCKFYQPWCGSFFQTFASRVRALGGKLIKMGCDGNIATSNYLSDLWILNASESFARRRIIWQHF